MENRKEGRKKKKWEEVKSTSCDPDKWQIKGDLVLKEKKVCTKGQDIKSRDNPVTPWYAGNRT